MNTFVTFHNMDEGIFFFSTDHCQPASDNWVPVTYRTFLSKEDYKDALETRTWPEKEVPNPLAEYQA